jgi:hypothetical protein
LTKALAAGPLKFLENLRKPAAPGAPGQGFRNPFRSPLR